MSNPAALMERLKGMQDIKSYQDLNWEGSFEEYLKIVLERPNVARSAF